MAEILVTFLIGSAIIFFGMFSEFFFKKSHVPDVLLLIIFGFILGPYALNVVSPSSLAFIAPLFTTFALLFLLFDGAFNIDLMSFIRGLGKGVLITIFNFIISAGIITVIALIFKFDFIHSLLLGFILGGISSAFVIPTIMGNSRIKKETYSILTLESAITDVLCIVFALTVMQVITLNSFSFNVVFSSIASLFAVAGMFGIIGGVIWIILIGKIFKKNKSYMLTIAYLLLLFTITEFLGGNGAIATLFFGLVLKNSKKLTSFVNSDNSFSVTTSVERLFYEQISFFLKTFFFVYIGILLDFSNIKAIFIGLVIAICIMLARNLTSILTRGLPIYDRKFINSIFARGLAAAVIAQLALQKSIANADLILKITLAAIMFTIILSSARVFFLNSKLGAILETKAKKKRKSNNSSDIKQNL